MSALKRKLAENWKFIIGVVMIGILLLPMAYTIFFTLPSTDDFSVACNVHKNSIFMDSFRYANMRFTTWTGLWPYMFIETLINPLILFPLESYGIGVEMLLLFSAFMIALFMMIATAAKEILGETKRENIAAYILAFLFVFLNTNIYSEIYYWFVGSSYMMAMTLGLVTITLTILYFYKEKSSRISKILLCVIGALACNFFQEAILPGMIYMILWICFSVREKKPVWKKSVPFWFMFVSEVIAVAAPGNYARHESFDSSLHIVDACVDACKIMLMIIKQMIQQPFFIALLIFFVYVGLRHERNMKGKWVILSAALTIATLGLNAFPIALGYAGADYFPNRLYFVLDLVFMVGMSVVSVCAGMYIRGTAWYKSCGDNGQVRMYLIGFIFLLLYTTIIYGQNVSKLPWVRTLAETRNVKQIHDIWQECLIEIRDSENRQVVIEIEEVYYDSPVLQLPRLTDDADNWKNRAAAKLYNKESVVVTQKEE